MIKLKIPKMKCKGCVAAINKALEGIEDMDEFEVKLAEKIVMVRPGKVEKEAVLQALAETGYPAEEI